MASSWSFAAFVDWLQGNPPGGPEEESGREAWRRRPRPRPRSIPWRPVDGEDPGELFETGWPDEVFVAQSVFREVRSHLPGDPGEQRYGFLLGQRLVCPATGDPYLLIDEIWSAPDPLRERGGTEQFERALGTARERASEGEKDVLGWYHTHSPIMGLQLSEHDVRLHARFFPERWHCALVEVAHGEEPVGGLFQRRERNRYPGTKLISFLEVTEPNGSGHWEEMESQLDWTNYATPRSGVRRVAPPRDPSPVIRTAEPDPFDEPAEPLRRRPPEGPTWKWLPLKPSEPEAAPPRRNEEPGRSPEPEPEPSAPARESDRAAASRERPVEPTGQPTPPRRRDPEPVAAASAAPARKEASAAPAREEAAADIRPPRRPREDAFPFRLEPSESPVAGASISRAVDGLRAVVAARKRVFERMERREPATSAAPADRSAPAARPAATRRPAPVDRRAKVVRGPNGGAAVPDVPIVIPAEDEDWPEGGRRLAASLGRTWKAFLLVPLLGAGLFFLLRSDGGSEPVAPAEFHPAAGPATSVGAASAGRAEFERLRANLSERLAAYSDRRAEFDLGRVDCPILTAAHRTAQRDFIRLSDHVASEDSSLSAAQREAWRGLAAETSAMDRHFETTGCEGAAPAEPPAESAGEGREAG